MKCIYSPCDPWLAEMRNREEKIFGGTAICVPVGGVLGGRRRVLDLGAEDFIHRLLRRGIELLLGWAAARTLASVSLPLLSALCGRRTSGCASLHATLPCVVPLQGHGAAVPGRPEAMWMWDAEGLAQQSFRLPY